MRRGLFAAEQMGEAAMQPVPQALSLNGLKIHLGPELRAMFPVVLNMGISGDVELTGAADPAVLRIVGTIYLDGGEVAAQQLSFSLMISKICSKLTCDKI
jgi:hypothetical protein